MVWMIAVCVQRKWRAWIPVALFGAAMCACSFVTVMGNFLDARRPKETAKSVRMLSYLFEAGQAHGRWFAGPALSRSVLIEARIRTGNKV